MISKFVGFLPKSLTKRDYHPTKGRSKSKIPAKVA